MKETWRDALWGARSATLEGKEQELRELQAHMDSEGAGWLHLHGPSGAGKSAVVSAFGYGRVQVGDVVHMLGGEFVRPGCAEAATLEGGDLLIVDDLRTDEESLRWLEHVVLATIPSAARLVTTSRDPLPPAFLAQFGADGPIRQRALAADGDVFVADVHEGAPLIALEHPARVTRELRPVRTRTTILPAARTRPDRADFLRQLRAALRALHDTSALQRNPLVWSSLVRDAAQGDDARARARGLTRALHVAVAELGDAGANGRHRELLRRAFMEPSAKQYALAVELGIGYSTFRRHLGTAIEALADELWPDYSREPQVSMLCGGTGGGQG